MVRGAYPPETPLSLFYLILVLYKTFPDNLVRIYCFFKKYSLKSIGILKIPILKYTQSGVY